MSSENLFEEDFSEEIITELEQEYVAESLNADRDETNEVDLNVPESSSAEVESNKNDNKVNPATTDQKLFQLPLTRIRNIMKLDPDLHIASNEAVFLVTRATELFIESLAQESYNFTLESKKKTIQKRDVDLAIDAVDSLMFLDGAMTF
ncbi:DNA polymerase epsilon subunit 4 [Lucilia sericata]|uniref:DNA polymerase epsilon subunit 4 n=1 Tax=Lucilia sericata TaxID=13632 RepID=UPI0018A867CF|nr:DNA polymerase epsilon subunit 4 [Lucilia sericata]